ncbi:UDP-N-acetylmuramate--L-alanine ligase [Nitrospirota bacterium]
MFERYKVIHFIGIGGIGMSGIAEVLHNLGYVVTGSDLNTSATTERLAGMGINIFIGHDGSNLKGAHVVVASSAVRDDNPEVLEAIKLAIPVIPRAEMLAELGRMKYGLLVAGSHGKTTTTSLLSTVLEHAGFDPTVVIGGKLKAIGTNARLGRGEFMVAEADESDGSFLKLSPTVGVVTNIDMEHMDYFGTMDALREAFLEFMNKVPFYGLSVICIDDDNIRSLLSEVHRKVCTYGFSEDADLRAVDVRTGFMSVSFEAVYKGNTLGRFGLPLPGEHNVLNALASIAVAHELMISTEKMHEAIDGFQGIQRRLEFKGEANGVNVYDDYGHHPTEITATLKAASDSIEGGKLIVIFQPHRYTRTKGLFNEFAASFGNADTVVMMDIYAASEKPIEGVSTEAIISNMNHSDVHHIRKPDDVAAFVAAQATTGDMVLTLGAGDVWKIGAKVIEKLGNA